MERGAVPEAARRHHAGFEQEVQLLPCMHQMQEEVRGEQMEHGCADERCASATGAGAVSNERPSGEVKEVVMLTEAAASKVKELMRRESKDGMGLRIYLQPGGGAGYTYGLTFDEGGDDGDVVLEQHGVRVYVEKQHVKALRGTVIDYVESLQGAGFTMKNPNVVASCGCGHSFGV